MKIWLDDKRPAPEGWLRCYWPDEVINILKFRWANNLYVEAVSLDHDLGDDDRGTGYDVLCWIEEQVVCNGYKPPRCHIHSDNSQGIQRMRLAIQSIEKHYLQKHGPRKTW